MTKIREVQIKYNLPPYSGCILVYPKLAESVLELATIQLRNKLKFQLPLGYNHFEIIRDGYIDVDTYIFTKHKKDKEVKQIKKDLLKQRAKVAVKPVEHNVQKLVLFLENNKNNINTIVSVCGYRSYLIKCGCSEEEAAKLCLELYTQ
jgi:hypothetical protein